MHYPQCGVAIAQGGQQDAQAIHIQNFAKAQLLLAHLGVDGVQRFLAPADIGGHICLYKGILNFCECTLDAIAFAPFGRS